MSHGGVEVNHNNTIRFYTTAFLQRSGIHKLILLILTAAFTILSFNLGK